MEENKLGWVAKVENYDDLNEKLRGISKLTVSELDTMKNYIFNQSHKVFNLDNQMNYLIANEVF